MTIAYPQDVLEIHNEFETASEQIIASANKILQESYNKKKANILSEIGFSATPEYKQYLAQERKLEKASKTIEAINSLKAKFPFHKAIDYDTIMTICNKWNLVFGENTLFKGFVPEKNAREVETFFKSYPKLTIKYTKSHIFSGSVVEITKEIYDEYKSNPGGLVYLYEKHVKELFIVAPENQIEMTGKMIKNHRVVDIPLPKDPIVLFPIKENGLQFYLILSKWGPEASDELLQDSTMN